MKKLGIMMVVCVCLFTGSGRLWAGGADNKTNWSAEYIGILNRNAATDAADIVMYNPAGVMEMENGWVGNLSAHYIAKGYNNKIAGIDHDQDEPSLVPGLFSVYKQDKWAGFFGVSNILGGGKVAFENGNATTNFAGFGIMQKANAGLAGAGVAPNFFYTHIPSQYLKAEQLGLGYTLGGACKLNENLSLSLGIRYLQTDREMTGSIMISPTNPLPPFNNPLNAQVSFEEEADGFGGIVGINYAPSDQVNLGFHYDSKIDLDYSQTVKTDTLGILPNLGIVHNGTRNRNLPAILAAGLSCKVTPRVRVEGNATLYLNKDAGFKDIAGTSRDESAVDTGYDLGLGMAYACNDDLTVTLGYLYTNTGVDARDMTPELPELDAHTLGTGLGYQLSEKLKLVCSLGHVFYQDASFLSATGPVITYEKQITFVGFGLEYTFF